MAFKIIRNDITKVKADAIVNTANPEVAIGDGVDSAIYEAAGAEKLLRARAKIGKLEIGNVGITPAFHLDAKYIIHSSSPYWIDGLHQEEELLRQCYDKALEIAHSRRCKSIAFPLLSTGTYGFSKEIGLKIALEAFQTFLLKHEMEIILVVFGDDAFRVSGKIFDDVRSYVSNFYVEQKLKKEYCHDGIPQERFSQEIPRVERVLQKGVHLDTTPKETFQEIKIPKEIDTSCVPIWTESNKRFLPASSTVVPQSASRRAADVNVEKKDLNHEESEEKVVELCSPKIEPTPHKLDFYMQQETGSFGEYLQQMINKKGMKNAEVYTAANLTKQYFSKLLKGKVTPSKTKILSLAIALRLNMDETIDFLRMSGYAFSPFSQVDKIFEYFIRNKIYDIYKIDIVLFDYGLPTLVND